MIIVEGPDGAGKTTLLRTLAEDLQLEIAPRVVSKDAEAMLDLVEWVKHNLKDGFQAKLYDRHRLISEPIYGPALRGRLEPGFDDAVWFSEMLFQLYVRVRPILIYCLPPFSTVWDNVMRDEDNAIFHRNGQALKQIYGGYFNKAITDHLLYNPRCWVFNYTSPQAESNYRLMLKYIQRTLDEEN